MNSLFNIDAQENMASLSASPNSIEFLADTELTQNMTVTGNSEEVIIVNLHGFKLTIPNEIHMFVNSGKFAFVDGTILCDGDGSIITAGSDTSIILGDNLYVSSDMCAVSITKRSKVIVDGANIQTDAGPAIEVIGFTLAKDNSSLIAQSGHIQSFKNSAVSVIKGGYVEVTNCNILAEADPAIDSDNGARTQVVINKSIIPGVLDEAEDIDKSVADVVTEMTDQMQVEHIAETSEETTAESNDNSKTEIPEPVVDASTIASKFGVLTNLTFVYGSPARKICIATIIGPITIIEHINSCFKVSFKMPGTGKMHIGYISEASRIKYN